MVGRKPINDSIGVMTSNQRKARERALKKAKGLTSVYVHKESWDLLLSAVNSHQDIELISKAAINLVENSNR